MSDIKTNQLRAQWAEKFTRLKGRTITVVRYLTDEECATMGWDRAPLVLQLDDGTLLFPSCDDEGNAAGALFTQHGKNTKGIPTCAPVI